MRIGFAGASGTGKSTLAAFVAEHYSLTQNPIGSRSVSAAMGFASPYDVDKAGKRAEFQNQLLTDKGVWEAANESFVTDRTTLDNLVYTMLHDVSAVTEEMLETVQVGMARYTHVIYCPVGAFCQVGDDTARVKNMAYHKVYDAALFGSMIRMSSVRWFPLWEPDLENRKKLVLECLGGI